MAPPLPWFRQTATRLTSQQLKLEFRKRTPTTMRESVWVYSMHVGDEDELWKDMYAFADAEYLASGFAVPTTTR